MGENRARVAPAADWDAVYRDHRSHLVALCYRMTGSHSDAEDLVQETFARALRSPPRDLSRDWRPWLVRVAVNLARDQLRRRKRAPYVGPWLPEPVPTPESEPPTPREPAAGEGRYALLESCSFAFLVALEQLTPSQRAVLLLRDVFEYSGAETAAALELSPANVRQLRVRARRALGDYDARRLPITDALRGRTQEVLSQFLSALASGDVLALEKLLARDVVALNDGGGHHFAARRPIAGRSKVARSSVKIAGYSPEPPELRVIELNGLPAVVGRYAEPKPGHAPEFAVLLTLDPSGQLWRTYTIVAPSKLQSAVRGAFGSR